MDDILRAQSRARLTAIETRLLELQGDLERGRDRDALETVCDLRGQ